jgi:pyruvate-formate lyase-activating enzyme
MTATVDSYREARAITGRYLHVQRLSTEDGPGIRSTVFFKGCALRCAWCHNPESLSFDPQVQWLERHCIGCDTCIHTCPEQCLQRDAEVVHIDRRRCNGCGLCVQECPAGAMELLGRQASIEELLAELLKDLAFYEQSGGGVTLSGGEPLLQSAYTTELMAQLRAAGIHTALDTCGMASPAALSAALAHADLVLYDRSHPPGQHTCQVVDTHTAHPRGDSQARESGGHRGIPGKQPGWTGGTLGIVCLQQPVPRQIPPAGYGLGLCIHPAPDPRRAGRAGIVG